MRLTLVVGAAAAPDVRAVVVVVRKHVVAQVLAGRGRPLGQLGLPLRPALLSQQVGVVRKEHAYDALPARAVASSSPPQQMPRRLV